MTTHLALYNDPALGSDVSAEFLPLSAVPDQILGFRNAAHVPSSPLLLLGLAAIGGDAEATFVGARVRSPKTVVSPLYVRPVNSDPDAVFPSNPGISAFDLNPFCFREGEEISAEAALIDVAEADAPASLVMILGDRIDPVPSGESIWVAFTADLTALAANVWQNFPISFSDSTTLPAGRYAVIGMHLVQTITGGLICGRLVIPGQAMRPGTIVSPTSASFTPDFASSGRFGVWGIFDAQIPPTMEIFSRLPAAANNVLTGYLKVIQLPR